MHDCWHENAWFEDEMCSRTVQTVLPVFSLGTIKLRLHKQPARFRRSTYPHFLHMLLAAAA